MNRLPFNLWFVLLLAILIAWAFSLTSNQQPTNQVAYTTFLNEIDQGRVAKIAVDGRQLNVTRKEDSDQYVTFAPSPVDTTTIREWGDKKIQVEVAAPRRDNP
ncbi:ATP-dependent metallopeptidase FtsH/Yme1/Tma family protein, partial [uncultured Meiothermus sp.]|uniref:ATP-dependent metallopeptidase FtsH/Yme1/Tma family protein n=1 Tax=uncultured Meiothermus sp. TaxID=157471 RepID=UPI002614CDD2